MFTNYDGLGRPPQGPDLRAPRPIGYLKALKNLKFATMDKTVFVGFVFSNCYEKTWEIDIPAQERGGFHGTVKA